MAFHDRLKQARLKEGLTQEELAHAIGVAKSTITGYEKANSEPSIEKICKIMEVLNVDANFLWQDEIKKSSEVVGGVDLQSDIENVLLAHGRLAFGSPLSEVQRFAMGNVISILEKVFPSAVSEPAGIRPLDRQHEYIRDIAFGDSVERIQITSEEKELLFEILKKSRHKNEE